jgi:hypothetical protein
MPSWAGLAGAGMAGVAEPLARVVWAVLRDPAPNDFPGSSAEASAARAAVSAAAPASIHRRVRLILSRAASRTSALFACEPSTWRIRVEGISCR